MRANTKIKNLITVSGAVLILALAGSISYADWKNNNDIWTAESNLAVSQIIQNEPETNPPGSNIADLQNQPGIPVLMYHHVGPLPTHPDRIRKDLTVSVADFTAQMDYLKANGFKTVTTQQLYDWTKGRFVMPDKPIVLTFDDGYTDTFNNAVPVLASRGMSGVFGIITEFPGLPDYASWDQIKAAQQAGMEIVPHTRTHIDLKNKHYTHQDRISQIQGSFDDIKSHLGTTPVAFIFPYGTYNSDALQILKDSPAKIAFTTHFGLFSMKNDLLLEPRVRVHGVEDLARFKSTLFSAK
ncbi:polysaccharide deacetylase family protein [Patescibacteria group bacterium]|nr:polysaccharide deacetylase family protein [Patescibacteria group bacterium]